MLPRSVGVCGVGLVGQREPCLLALTTGSKCLWGAACVHKRCPCARCGLLNCEVVLELLSRALEDPSDNVRMVSAHGAAAGLHLPLGGCRLRRDRGSSSAKLGDFGACCPAQLLSPYSGP